MKAERRGKTKEERHSSGFAAYSPPFWAGGLGGNSEEQSHLPNAIEARCGFQASDFG